MTLRTLVVVPAWNEESSIGRVVRDLLAQGFDVLVVDDGSTDRTGATALSEGALLATLPFNLGVGAALRCGFRFATAAGYDVAVQCDADGQHPVDHIKKLVHQIVSSDAHMIIGSRFLEIDRRSMKVSTVRRTAMHVLSFSASRAAGSRITDSTSGFRAIRQPLLSELAQKISPYYLGDTYEAIVSAGRAGYQVQEIYTPIAERTHGVSSARPLTAARLAIKAILSAFLNVNPRLMGPESKWKH